MKRLTQEEVSATWFAADVDCMAMLCAGIVCLPWEWHTLVNLYQKDKTLVSDCLDVYQKAQSVSDVAAWIDFQVHQKAKNLPHQLDMAHLTLWPQVNQFCLSRNQIQTHNRFAQEINDHFKYFVENGTYPFLFKTKGLVRPHKEVCHPVLGREA